MMGNPQEDYHWPDHKDPRTMTGQPPDPGQDPRPRGGLHYGHRRPQAHVTINALLLIAAVRQKALLGGTGRRVWSHGRGL